MANKDNDKKHKQTREAQMSGERKKYERNKKFYDSADVVRNVLEQSGMPINEANSKNVRRIIELMRKITGRDTLKEKDTDIFNKIVGVTKRIYDEEEGTLKKLLSREMSGKNLTVEEYDILISAFMEEMKKGRSDEEQDIIEKRIKSLKGDDLIEEAIHLKEHFIKEHNILIDRLLEIENPETRMTILGNYKEFINNSLENLNTSITRHVKLEKALKSLFIKEPELINSEEILIGNLSDELKARILVEMDLEDIINDIREHSK